MKKQPLGYQQQNSSCWITSVMNGLIYLLGSAEKIPNEVATILYAISSRDGTQNQEADSIVSFINAYSLRVKCSIYKQQEVTWPRLKNTIARGGVVVADVMSGWHGVLVTGIEGSNVELFDPDWSNVTKGLQGKIMGAEFTLEDAFYNVLIHRDEFFAKRSTETHKLRMGAEKSRYFVTMFRT